MHIRLDPVYLGQLNSTSLEFYIKVSETTIIFRIKTLMTCSDLLKTFLIRAKTLSFRSRSPEVRGTPGLGARGGVLCFTIRARS